MFSYQLTSFGVNVLSPKDVAQDVCQMQADSLARPRLLKLLYLFRQRCVRSTSITGMPGWRAGRSETPNEW